MNELEEKLNELLRNPQLMQQVAGLAQAMGGTKREEPVQAEDKESASFPVPDPRQMQIMLQAVNQTGVDKNQKALLAALSPYLSKGRLSKLERAMRAAKIAGAASLFLQSGVLQPSSGR